MAGREELWVGSRIAMPKTMLVMIQVVELAVCPTRNRSVPQRATSVAPPRSLDARHCSVVLGVSKTIETDQIPLEDSPKKSACR